MLTQISFLIMGILAVFLSALMITRKWPVTAAMLLIVVMMLLAGMYGLLGAHFSAVSQIIVYAGAIMVVFVFVIMLLNLPPEELRYGRVTLGELVLTVLGFLVALFLGTKVGQGYLVSGLNSVSLANARPPYYPASMNENVKNVSALMFTDYLWAFELISFLILVAIVGAIVIAKKAKVNDAKSS
ncbi:NADH-quinone oxidoreductase subunit J [Pigmentibacter sp. JX0631]|uniref:NADH-quinone oxidoreductase subunit J n=1 Tax=Pigmentibacter sp. JX0631 TaxID=2976982 RepID=UPI0024684CC3|nr:NADH-quinone oxidoreductase subunit J [Pigmentibacter sp. JX0631]WGL61191.1 NADH-quinone oxidoreductase subunit J [Pigmentibacter sp. JX0631]